MTTISGNPSGTKLPSVSPADYKDTNVSETKFLENTIFQLEKNVNNNIKEICSDGVITTAEFDYLSLWSNTVSDLQAKIDKYIQNTETNEIINRYKKSADILKELAQKISIIFDNKNNEGDILCWTKEQEETKRAYNNAIKDAKDRPIKAKNSLLYFLARYERRNAYDPTGVQLTKQQTALVEAQIKKLEEYEQEKSKKEREAAFNEYSNRRDPKLSINMPDTSEYDNSKEALQAARGY